MKQIFIVLFLYLLFSGLMRFLKIRKAIKNQRREYENRVNKNQKPEGEIDILKTGSKNNSNNSQAGEYVDFEEVDE